MEKYQTKLNDFTIRFATENECPLILKFIKELADYENLTQEEAALKMNISRPTFTRLYDKARKNIAKAFVEGKVILIQGGNYITDSNWYKCRVCNETMNSTKSENHCINCDSENLDKL